MLFGQLLKSVHLSSWRFSIVTNTKTAQGTFPNR